MKKKKKNAWLCASGASLCLNSDRANVFKDALSDSDLHAWTVEQTAEDRPSLFSFFFNRLGCEFRGVFSGIVFCV